MDIEPTKSEDQAKGPVVPYASNAPGPLGTPKPRKDHVVLSALMGVGSAGAVVALIASVSITPCRGATRSARLKLEGRQQEVDKAIAQASAADNLQGTSRDEAAN